MEEDFISILDDSNANKDVVPPQRLLMLAYVSHFLVLLVFLVGKALPQACALLVSSCYINIYDSVFQRFMQIRWQ